MPVPRRSHSPRATKIFKELRNGSTISEWRIRLLTGQSLRPLPTDVLEEEFYAQLGTQFATTVFDELLRREVDDVAQSVFCGLSDLHATTTSETIRQRCEEMMKEI